MFNPAQNSTRSVMIVLLLLSVLFLVSGCATSNPYANPNLTQEQKLELYRINTERMRIQLDAMRPQYREPPKQNNITCMQVSQQMVRCY